jgi:hypothetical protein
LDGSWLINIIPDQMSAAADFVAPHDTAPHDTAPHDTAPHDTAPHDTAPHDTMVSHEQLSLDNGNVEMDLTCTEEFIPAIACICGDAPYIYFDREQSWYYSTTGSDNGCALSDLFL